MRNFIVLTLFKEAFSGFIDTSIIKRAIDQNIVNIHLIDIRDYSLNKHKKVDFPPVGGGSGMVISPEPLGLAIDKAYDYLKNDIKSTNDIKIIYMSPRGFLLNQKMSYEFANTKNDYIIICGHYEGIDERIIEKYNVLEISIGDYVLTQGELASQVFMDSVIRLIDGTIKKESLEFESHTNGLLEYPQYTKPILYDNMKVPEILLSGNHQKIAEYRKMESIRITKKYRPDLLNKI